MKKPGMIIKIGSIMKERLGFVSNSSTSSFIAVCVPHRQNLNEKEMAGILIKDNIDISQVHDIFDKFYNTYFYGREGVSFFGITVEEWEDEIPDKELDMSLFDKHKKRVAYLLDIPIDKVQVRVGTYSS